MVELLNHRFGIWFPLAVVFRIYVETLRVARVSHIGLYRRADLAVI